MRLHYDIIKKLKFKEGIFMNAAANFKLYDDEFLNDVIALLLFANRLINLGHLSPF